MQSLCIIWPDALISEKKLSFTPAYHHFSQSVRPIPVVFKRKPVAECLHIDRSNSHHIN